MLRRRFSLAVLAAALAAPGAALAQDGWTAPRTPDGQPDMQGLWTNSTTTPLERPRDVAERTVYTDEEVAAIDAGNVGRNDRPPPPGDPGTYNDFWWERGTALARTSLVIDPPDGRLPPRTADGDARAGWARGTDTWTDRAMAERCVTRGAPKRPGGYNNHFLVLQTPGYVVMLQEMIHEPRIIPLAGGPPVDDRIRLWMGDSRGRWEGDTLVVETTNFRDEIYTSSFNCCPGASGTLTMVERFTRVDADTIEHHYTVNDPDTYTRPWTASIPMRRFAGPMYEYACHEGNYGWRTCCAGRACRRARPRGGSRTGEAVPMLGGRAYPYPQESVMDLQCTAVFRKVPEGYIAFIEEFPGANTQGASLEECRRNLREAVALVVEANRVFAREDVPVGAVIREPFNVTA